jgi:putative Holliday junction resolvase
MRILGIDYGEARCGIAITDALNITAQGLETIHCNSSDKVILKRLDEIFMQYEVDTIVVGMPLNMDGTMSKRAEITNEFIHKLKCKYNKMKIETIDERLTTVSAHKTMNFLDVNKHKKRNIVDTISAVYILETYLNKMKNSLQNEKK